MKYDAFISYRHTPLDMEMAKKLHKGLETFRLPAAVKKKAGKKDIKRVFRDQEELPIGSDLDENISTALKESEYLIVICSPNTPASEWVCKEIDTFISLHDRAHVLAMLVEGEPNESFPPQLLTDENGVPVEPLAADVRGETAKERNKKFKTELLRLVAAVVGCNFDDLRQRHRERKIRKIVTISTSVAAVVAAAGIAFGIYNSNVAKQMMIMANEKATLADEKTNLAESILAAYKDKQKNQSRFYARSSLSLLEQGDRRAAVLMAVEGLPTEGNDRPYVPEAEYALSEALHAYDVGEDREYDRVLKHDFVVSGMKVSSDRERLTTIDSGENVTVWDTSNWTELVKIDSTIDDHNYIVRVVDADSDKTGVYVADEQRLIKYDYEGNELYRVDGEGDGITECIVINHESDNGYFVYRNGMVVFDKKTGKIIRSIETDEEDAMTERVVYDSSEDILACAHYETDAKRAVLSIHKGDSETRVAASQGYILDMCKTDNKNIVVLSCNSDFYMEGYKDVRLDLISYDGNTVWSKKLDPKIFMWTTAVSKVRAHSYEEDGKSFNSIVVCIEHYAVSFDELTGKMLSEITLSGEMVTLNLALTTSIGYAGYATGNIAPIDFDKGQAYSDYDIKADLAIRDVQFIGTTIAVSAFRSSNVYILSTHKASDLKETTEIDRETIFEASAPDSDYFVFTKYTDEQEIYFYDKQGKLLYTFKDSEAYVYDAAFNKDTCIIYTSKALFFVDPHEKKCESKPFESFGHEDHYSAGYMTENGHYGVFWRGTGYIVIDMESKSLIYEGETEDYIGNAVISEDGKTLFISGKNSALCSIDLATGKSKEFSDEFIGLANYASDNYITVSKDGRYAAMCCMDGNIRIINTADSSVKATIELQTKNNTFLSFTDDGSHLFIQGDDYRLRIWDVENNQLINSVDCFTGMKFTVSDDEDGMVAVGDGYRMFVFETSSYGQVAYLPYGVAYFKDSNEFVLKNRTQLYLTSYKNSTTLMAEAQKQFPNEAFTDEEKVLYNIN